MTNKKISTTDHIITNSIYNNDFKTAIIKTDISDRFPIKYAFKLRSSMSSENRQKNKYLYKVSSMKVQRQHSNFDYRKLLGTQLKA